MIPHRCCYQFAFGISCSFSSAAYNYVPPSANLTDALRILVNYLNSSLHLLEEQSLLPFNESQMGLKWKFAAQVDSTGFRALVPWPQRILVVLHPWSLLLQRPLYCFISWAFQYWPMCASFKKAVQILVVWLEYLEPWNTVPESKGRPAVSDDLYMEAENKLLRDPAKSLLPKQDGSDIPGRSIVQGSIDGCVVSCRYSAEWQDYVLANYLFYTSLAVHFLVFAHRLVDVDREAVLQMTHMGEILAVAGGGSASVKLWSTATWRTDVSLAVPKMEGVNGKSTDKSGGKFALAVAWSPDGKRLACSAMDGSIAIFDVARGKFLFNLEGHYMPVRSLVFSPTDSRVLFTASDDRHIHMYDVESKSLICAMSGHASWVLSIDVSPDGAAVATGSSDKTVRLWDLSMRSSVQKMTNHTEQVWGVAFCPPGGQDVRAGRLASVSDDKSISLYDYS